MSETSYSPLELWFFRDVERRRQEMIKQRPLPQDGAEWACMVIFFGVAGFADPRITVKYVSPAVADRMLELWPKRETWFNVINK